MTETNPGADDSLRVQVVTKENELRLLAPSWNDLYARARDAFVTQTFEWVWCVWKSLMAGAQLRFVFVWCGDRLVLVWPGAIVRFDRFWTAEVPVATLGDYVDFLAEDSAEAGRAAQLAWHNRSRKADLTVVGRVRVSSLLHQVITDEGAKPFLTVPAHYLNWDEFSDWATYYARLPRRKAIAKNQRKLAEQSCLCFKLTEEPEEMRTLCKWMLHNKKVWLPTHGGKSPWLGSKSYEDFLFSVLESVKTQGHMAAFSLSLNERVVAVKIAVLGPSRITLLHDADDQEYRRFTPQHILTVHILESACERRLMVDFCAGSEPYKADFAPGNRPIEDFRIPNKQFGQIHESVIALKKTKAANLVRYIVRGFVAKS
jgi:CelD/BcsL family acetyltransferase involved in cellulose biosynthesis